MVGLGASQLLLAKENCFGSCIQILWASSWLSLSQAYPAFLFCFGWQGLVVAREGLNSVLTGSVSFCRKMFVQCDT